MLNEQLLFKKSICVCLCLVGLAFNVNANISIQEPIMQSYIGQSLAVSIPVTADADDWDTLWGTVETLTGEILEMTWRRPYSPGNIGYIDVKTANNINTPVVDLVVRVESIKNKIITSYPILLENPTPPTQIEQNNYSNSISDTQPKTLENSPILKSAQPQQAIPSEESTSNRVQSHKIIVKAGDNLYSISKKYKDPKQSTWNMMQIIYKNNKKAFGKTMGVLYTGAILTF